MVSRIRIGECESGWFYYIKWPSPLRDLINRRNFPTGLPNDDRVGTLGKSIAWQSSLRKVFLSCRCRPWKFCAEMLWPSRLAHRRKHAILVVYPLIESALRQVGRQDSTHVSTGEGIVTTRQCVGKKGWGDDDSVMVTNQR